MIKAIIFDLNGIFIQSPNLSDRFKEDFDVPLDKFLPVLKEIMGEVRKPNAGDSFLYWQPYLQEWGINMNKEELFDYWFKAEKEVSELIDIVKQLKEKGIRLFILSNNFKERTEYYQKNFLFLDKLFDRLYYSWQTGFVKPSPESFNNILKENNLNPEDCIYFDNSEENIKVASGLGIKSFLFVDINKLKNDLKV